MKRAGPRPENLEAWMLLSAPTGAAAGPIPRQDSRFDGGHEAVRADYCLPFRA